MPAVAENQPAIHVAAGVLLGDDGRVLIAQRPEKAELGGSWEFPGGKIKLDETPLQGLVRELAEELGIRVTYARHLVRYYHDYPERRVYLYVWLVLGWDSDPTGAEGQPLCWKEVDSLMGSGLLSADLQIVECLQRNVAVNTTSVLLTL